jgi:hypothetical protein
MGRGARSTYGCRYRRTDRKYCSKEQQPAASGLRVLSALLCPCPDARQTSRRHLPKLQAVRIPGSSYRIGLGNGVAYRPTQQEHWPFETGRYYDGRDDGMRRRIQQIFNSVVLYELPYRELLHPLSVMCGQALPPAPFPGVPCTWIPLKIDFGIFWGGTGRRGTESQPRRQRRGGAGLSPDIHVGVM